MATRNGAAFLGAQLASLAAQDHADWALWVSDDGSTDATRALLADFAAARRGRNPVRVVEGPGRGAAANFLSLLARPDLPLGPGTHVAFCDQDDVWLPARLSAGLAALRTGDGPALAGGAAEWIDTAGRPLGRGDLPAEAPDLAGAMLWNPFPGNAMLLNPAAVALARAAGRPEVPFHDWWLLLLVLAAGGRAVPVAAPLLRYRAHGGNVLGPRHGLRAGLGRLRLLAGGGFGGWVAANRAALAAAPVDLTPAARALLAALDAAPARGPARLARLSALGLGRPGRGARLALALAMLAGRV